MIAIHDFNLQVAKQTARGAYPAAPTYFLEVVEGGLSSKPNIDSLNICDGRIFGASKKRIGYVETGGQPTITAQPKDMGALVAWCFGADSVAGGADPYTHTITPATSLASFPYFTVWQNLDDQWYQFRDCQIVSLEIVCGVDNKFMFIKPTIVGFAKEKKVAAPAGATQETDTVHWLDAGGYHCLWGDFTNLDHSSIPTSAAELYTWLGTFKTKWNAHCAVATGRHHKAADAVNTLGYATPVAALADAYVALDEIETDLNAHMADTATHYFADVTNTFSWDTPASEATALACAATVIGAVNSPGKYNGHVGAIAGARSVKLTFDMNATPIQGEGMTAYAVQRKPGTISIATDMLLEDFRLINLAKFGDPAAAAGTELTTEIQTLSFATKFTASTTGNERSIAISVPQFDLDPEPLMGLMGNPEGTEPIVTVGGEASGTAPIATVTVVGSVSAY